MKSLFFIILAFIFVGCNESGMINEQNQNKLVSTHTYYQDENGTMQLGTEYTYDEYGNLLTFEDYIYGYIRIENTYDDKQFLASKKTIHSSGDAVIVSYSYNEQGQKLSEIWDINGSGWDWQENFTYNEAGNILSSSYDSYADGVVDAVKYFTYDLNDNMLTHGWDYDLDGEVDHYEIVNTYDESGNIISNIQSYEWNTGSNNTSTYYYYDEDDLLIEEAIDNYSDESIDRVKYYTYNVKNELILLREEQGEYMNSIEYEYDSNGNIIMTNIHYSYPEELNHWDDYTSYTYDYDAYGNLISDTCSGSCSQKEKYREHIWRKL